MVDGGTDRTPRVERGDRAVGTEGEHDASAVHAPERVHRQGAGEAEPLLVELPGGTPGGIEGGLDAGYDAEVGHRRDRLRCRHLGVLEPVAGSDDGVSPDLVGGGLEPGDRLFHRPVTDDVEAGLQATLGAEHDVVGDLSAVEVEMATGVTVGVRPMHGGSARPDGSVDAEVSGEPHQQPALARSCSAPPRKAPQ